MGVEHSLYHVRMPPSRSGEALAMTLSYAPKTSATTGAIVASPLPFLGGDMDNNVVRTLAEAIAARGLPALRYDYRSVGESADVVPGEAHYETWKRVEETGDRSAVIADAAEALRRASALFTPVLLAGYSFGCWTAVHTATTMSASAALPLVLVAPPLANVDLGAVATHAAPVLMVFAGDDALCPPLPRDELCAQFPSARIDLLDGADHFFRGREADLARTVTSFLNDPDVRLESMESQR
jgi:alpha/beta superfamily hydrolase